MNKVISNLEKLQQKQNLLLNEYLTARLMYDFVTYTYNNEHIRKRFGRSYGSHGFNIICALFFEDISKRLYNISFDNDKNSLSIKNFIHEIKQHKDALEEFIRTPVHINFPHYFSEKQKNKIIDERSQTQVENFYYSHKELLKKFDTLKSSHITHKIKKIRHKVSAHFDVSTGSNSISRTTISDSHLKIDELTTFIEDVEKLISLCSECCGKSFAFDSLPTQHAKIAIDFWDKARATEWAYRGGVKISTKRRRRAKSKFKFLKTAFKKPSP